MRIKIWGARGSLPSPYSPQLLEELTRHNLEDFAVSGTNVENFLASLPRHRLGGYGGNTPCIDVTTAGAHVIIDGGSGIRPLGYEMMNGPCGRGTGEAHLFFTHFHWDHLIGLPFFIPFFVPGNKIHVYAVQPELKEIFETLFKKPYFPVPLASLGATIVYHQLKPREKFQLNDLTITPYQLDHPDPCWGFRFESGGRTFSHCVDTECVRVSREQMGPDLPLYQNVDLMLFDAQYTILETIEKVHWGHAAASLGVDVALREGIKRVIFMHHDPASSPEKIAAAEAQARHYYDSQIKMRGGPDRVDWQFAYEGMEVEV